VLAAGDSRSPGGRDALEDLCRAYWPPVYAYVRRRGYDSEESRDLTQGFFTHLLEGRRLKAARQERGRFRSFLLASVKNYLANEWDRTQARKRGGGTVPLSLDFDRGEREYALEPAEQITPEKIFERRWALTLLERVVERLRQELEESGDRARADRLLPFLTDEKSRIPYKQVAAELGMSESAVKVAVHRMRKRYGALLRQEVEEIVQGADQVDAEIRHLFSAVGPGLS
jgi:RNA polymerase sigma-70 factor (ECF subfamily)